MCDDLSKWEVDAIDSVEQRYEEVALKANVDSEACLLRLENRFKEVALAITQLYTSYHSGTTNTRADAYSAFRTAACKLTDFYNESKGNWIFKCFIFFCIRSANEINRDFRLLY